SMVVGKLSPSKADCCHFASSMETADGFRAEKTRGVKQNAQSPRMGRQGTAFARNYRVARHRIKGKRSIPGDSPLATGLGHGRFTRVRWAPRYMAGIPHRPGTYSSGHSLHSSILRC